ncbi:MAG: TIGR03067 domain-containing protein [Gemmataceae bacterium]
MSRSVVPLLLALSAATVAAPLPFPKPRGQPELRALQGEWVGARRKAVGGQVSLVVRGDRIAFLLDGETRTVWSITLDPAKSPKAMDLKRVDAKDRGQVLPCAYRLDRDELTLARAAGPKGHVRPADLEPRAGFFVESYRRKR